MEDYKSMIWWLRWMGTGQTGEATYTRAADAIENLLTENAALRRQECVGEANKALTLDELRQMDGEPVWWWNTSAKPVCTICVRDRFMGEPMFANYDWQSEDTLKLSKYKWLKKCGYKPYRHNPEEEGTV